MAKVNINYTIEKDNFWVKQYKKEKQSNNIDSYRMLMYGSDDIFDLFLNHKLEWHKFNGMEMYYITEYCRSLGYI